MALLIQKHVNMSLKHGKRNMFNMFNHSTGKFFRFCPQFTMTHQEPLGNPSLQGRSAGRARLQWWTCHFQMHLPGKSKQTNSNYTWKKHTQVILYREISIARNWINNFIRNKTLSWWASCNERVYLFGDTANFKKHEFLDQEVQSDVTFPIPSWSFW